MNQEKIYYVEIYVEKVRDTGADYIAYRSFDTATEARAAADVLCRFLTSSDSKTVIEVQEHDIDENDVLTNKKVLNSYTLEFD